MATKAKPKGSSISTSAGKKPRSKNSGAPGWVGPAAVGGGLLIVGLGVLLSRKASASQADGSTPGNDKLPDIDTLPDAVPSNDDTAPSNDDSSPSNDTPPPADIVFPVFSGDAGAAKIKELGQLAGLDKEWIRFFLVTARGESAFTSNVVLGDPTLYPAGSKASPYTDTLGKTEAAGARTAYERGRKEGRYVDCPWPAEAFTFGSGGWFGMVVANAWAAYKDTSLRCRHPWHLLHPVDQIITAMEIARRLRGWSAFKANPTWLTLRVGWGNPSGMDDPQSHERIALKIAPHLKALGIPHDWMNQKVTSLPSGDVVARWEALMKAAQMDPGKRGV